MHRLPVFQHYEIGYIHDVVYRAHTRCAQLGTKPERRRSYLHIAHDTRRIARAERGIEHVNLYVFTGCLSARCGVDHRLGKAQLTTEGRSCFTRYADIGKAVRTVEGKLELDNGVAQAANITDIVAGLAILAQEEYPVLRGIWEIVRGEPQLADRAEHPFGKDTAQLAGLYHLSAGKMSSVQAHGYEFTRANVLCAGHYLQLPAAADIEPADYKVIRIRVRLG